MNDVPVTLRAETLALDALIQGIIAKVEASAGQGPPDRLVFLGNRHQAFPTAVIQDPVLEPVDKLVWMVIMLAVGETGGNTALPGYEAIGRMANVSSRSTIARAIAILRATRWLTLCARLRQSSGRFCGNVYALHEEPLPLADALYLDTHYRAFLSQALAHGHARVRAVAERVLDTINAAHQAGQAVGAPVQPIERRRQSRADAHGTGPRRCFAFTEQVVKRLRSGPSKRQNGGDHPDQNSNAAGDRVRNLNVQKSNSVCSSSVINKTTTTTDASSKFDLTGEGGQPLVYPARLANDHRDIAARALSALAPEQRQPILDELEGRFRAETQGMKPVYDALSFLRALCQLTRRGKFQPNLGIKVREGRRGGKRPEPERPTKRLSAPAKETDAQRQERIATGRARVSEMRTVLGLRAPKKKQSVTGES
jgi:hypothetical protein